MATPSDASTPVAPRSERRLPCRLHLLLLLAAVVLSCLSGSIVSGSVDVGECRVAARIQRTLSLPPAQRKPMLLFWDTEGVNRMMYGIWFGPDAYYRCPVECELSNDKADFGRAEAVLFWATPVDKGVAFDQKCPGQVWLQSSTEAFDGPILDRTPPQGRMADGRPSPIDMEVTWRRSLGEEKVSWLNNYDWNMDYPRASASSVGVAADAARHSATWLSDEILPRTKTREGRDPDQASVAAFISNCGAQSPRLELLEELQKYIRVDSYGKCAHNRDVPDHWTEEQDLSRGVLTQKNRILQKRYKFLLAMENTEVDDYVTEKFYHPLTIGVLPIVLGAPNIDEYSPALPGAHPAFLNMRDFRNMSDLARLIEELDRDDAKYLRYFEWRRALPEVAPLFKSALQYSWRDSPCMVCQSLHRRLYANASTPPVPLQGILPEVYDRRRLPLSSEERLREAEKAKEKRERRRKRDIERKQAKERATAAEEAAKASTPSPVTKDEL